MYDKTTIVDDTIQLAKDVIINSRKQYDPLMKVIEKFISENDIIVKENNNYFFNLYTTDMYSLPKKLTNLLYNTNEVLAKYVTLMFKINKYHYRISLNGITFVHFTYINPAIKSNILDYKCKGVFSDVTYKCFGPELDLINLYTNIVNPINIDSWTDLFNREQILAKEIINKLKIRISEIKHGGDKHSKSDNTFKKDEKNIYQTILDEFISDKHVLIGSLAICIYKKYNKINTKKIQIITQNSFNEEITNFKKLFPKVKYTISHLKIPIDLNMYKLTFSLNNITIIDIFNTGMYELIPYNNITLIFDLPIYKDSLRIGSPYVIKKYKLIDIWSLLFITKLNIIDTNKSNIIINNNIRDYSVIHDISHPVKILFPLTYNGFFEDIILNKERIANRLKIKYIPPYIPHNNVSNTD